MEASDTEESGVHAEVPRAPIGGSNELLDVGQEDNQVKTALQVTYSSFYLYFTYISFQMEEFLGPQAEYNEEEEERKYYRRKRLGVIKNVLASSFGAMIVYSVYMGEWRTAQWRGALRGYAGVRRPRVRPWPPQGSCRCSSSSIMT